ncbi:hypothetical protein D3C72_1688350 [compost metagenome]
MLAYRDFVDAVTVDSQGHRQLRSAVGGVGTFDDGIVRERAVDQARACVITVECDVLQWVEALGTTTQTVIEECMSGDFRLRGIQGDRSRGLAEQVQPGLVQADDGGRHSCALAPATVDWPL